MKQFFSKKYKYTVVHFNRFVQANALFFILMIGLNISSLFNDLFLKILYQWDGSFLSSLLVLYIGAAYFSRLIFILCAIGILLCLVKKETVKNAIKLVLVGSSGIITVVDIFTLDRFHQIFGNALMRICMATNIAESIGFIKTYADGFFYTVEIVLSGAVLLYLTYYLLQRYWQKASGVLLWITFFQCIICIVIFSMFPKIILQDRIAAERIVVTVPVAYAEQQIYHEKYENMQTHTATLTRNDSSIPYVVFVLGESTSRNHMSLYGYSLPTTPLLEKRRQQGNLYVFQDAISPDSYTQGSLKRLFTFYRTDSTGTFSDYTDVFTILAAAGYDTTWISNQESSGKYGDMGLLYAHLCHQHYFTRIHDFDAYTPYDAAVLPLLEQTLAASGNKKFAVVHVMGAHFNYADRYPENFALFSGEDETGMTSGNHKDQRAAYDNAVLYDDYVVDEIIKRVEDKNAIVIFISDHGEDVFDERKDFCGHGPHGDFRMLEIPMVIWVSDTCKQIHPDLVKKIAGAVHRPFMTDDMIHTILDMMDIETPEYDPTKSVVNHAYDSSRKRMYRGKEYIQQYCNLIK